MLSRFAGDLKQLQKHTRNNKIKVNYKEIQKQVIPIFAFLEIPHLPGPHRGIPFEFGTRFIASKFSTNQPVSTYTLMEVRSREKKNDVFQRSFSSALIIHVHRMCIHICTY